MKLLLVEDNEELSLWLAKALRDAGFEVDAVADGQAALGRIAHAGYGLVLLDLKLPDMDGRAVLRRLRRERNDLPVLVLTASGSLDIKVESLEIGADDYLVKPFEVRELVARIKVLIRRHGGSAHPVMHCADLAFDIDSREFRIDTRPLALTPREHAVLEALMRRQGRTLSKAHLALEVLGDGDAADDAIEIYVHRLRRKLEGSRAAIVTLRGVGYLLRESDANP